MRRTLCALALMLAAVTMAAAQDASLGGGASVGYGDGAYTGRIDLQMTIARLAAMASRGELSASDGTAYLLYGTMSRPVVASEEPFVAVAEYLEGEWIGTSKVVLHRVYLVFRGEAYREFLSGVSGMKAVVTVRDATVKPAPDGTPSAYLEVMSLRPVY